MAQLGVGAEFLEELDPAHLRHVQVKQDEPPVIRDGYLELPQGAGLGVDLADDLEARFPYLEGSYGVPIGRG